MNGFHSNGGRALATLLYSTFKWDKGEIERERNKLKKKIVSVVGI